VFEEGVEVFAAFDGVLRGQERSAFVVASEGYRNELGLRDNEFFMLSFRNLFIGGHVCRCMFSVLDAVQSMEWAFIFIQNFERYFEADTKECLTKTEHIQNSIT